jgi:hypothetical protein
MTSARRPNTFLNPPPHSGDLRAAGARPGLSSEPSADALALRSLLLLSGAAHPGDPILARLTDEDLAMLRATLTMLPSSESTSAA